MLGSFACRCMGRVEWGKKSHDSNIAVFTMVVTLTTYEASITTFVAVWLVLSACISRLSGPQRSNSLHWVIVEDSFQDF